MGNNTNEIILTGDSRRSPLRRALDSARSLVKLKELDLDTARNILLLVVDTHENTIDEFSDLRRLGPYSIKDVRRALKVVAMDAFYKHEGNIATIDDFFESRYNNGGIRYENDFFMAKTCDSGFVHVKIHSTKDRPSTVSMELKQHLYTFLITTEVPVIEPKDEMVRFYAGLYIDNRPDYKTEVVPYGEFEISHFRKSWLGFRWLAYNLLHWDEGFKFPEEIGPTQPRLSSSQTKRALLARNL